MKYIVFLFLLTTFSLKSFCQLDYSELDNLNTICKKEDFEAAKTFLKNSGYYIDKDDENFDHGSYFVLADIIAKKKLGEYNDEILKSINEDDIFDKIEIIFNDYEDRKMLSIDQSFETNNSFDISDQKKFNPLYEWLYEDWDYIKYEGVLGDSVWRKTPDNKNNMDACRKYFATKKFKAHENFTITFRKNDLKLGKKDYKLYYEDRDFSGGIPDLYYAGVILRTTLIKGENILRGNKNTFAFPLLKNGSSYLIKIKFGNIIKTYLLDSGASDMTIDDQTFQYLKSTNQLSIENNLTTREYILADGSKVEYKRLQIPTFSINDIIINNINAVLVGNGKPLLLGKSFLDNFKSWKVDNNTNTLIVETF